MATSEISNLTVKRTDYPFYLTNYTFSNYYVTIPNYKSIAGIPANAKILGATLAGWGNIGTNPISIALDDSTLWVVVPFNTTIHANSYATVRFSYI